MSNEFIVYGMIDAGVLGPAYKRNLHQLNSEVLCSLPETDEWPRITRSMFSISGTEVTFRSQIIHFGASYNHLEVENWIAKFEKLLRKLYWITATAHIEIELGGGRKLEWLVDDASFDAFLLDPPKSVSTWTFSTSDTCDLPAKNR